MIERVQAIAGQVPCCVACGIRVQYGPMYRVVLHEPGEDTGVPEGVYHEDCLPAGAQDD